MTIYEVNRRNPESGRYDIELGSFATFHQAAQFVEEEAAKAQLAPALYKIEGVEVQGETPQAFKLKWVLGVLRDAYVDRDWTRVEDIFETMDIDPDGDL